MIERNQTERLRAHLESVESLLARQRALDVALRAEVARVGRALDACDIRSELHELLAEQYDSVSAASQAASALAVRVAWMVATARDMCAHAAESHL